MVLLLLKVFKVFKVLQVVVGWRIRFLCTNWGWYSCSFNVGIATTNPVTPLQVEQVYGVKTGIGTFNASAGISTDFDSSIQPQISKQQSIQLMLGSVLIYNLRKFWLCRMEHQHTLKNIVMFNPSLVVSIGATMTEYLQITGNT